MEAKEIQQKLESMKGSSFEYAKSVHVVESYTINSDDEVFTIKTSINRYDRKFSSAKEFFKYWVEVDADHKPEVAKVNLPQTPATNNLNISVLVEQENMLTSDLISILKDNIKKVNESADFIPQAQAINNNVNSIIDITKLKVEMLKLLNKNNGN